MRSKIVFNLHSNELIDVEEFPSIFGDITKGLKSISNVVIFGWNWAQLLSLKTTFWQKKIRVEAEFQIIRAEGRDFYNRTSALLTKPGKPAVHMMFIFSRDSTSPVNNENIFEEKSTSSDMILMLFRDGSMGKWRQVCNFWWIFIVISLVLNKIMSEK